MPEARYVRSLSKAEEQALRELYRRTQNADIRTRCQMILLSAQEHGVSEISELTFFNEDSVLYWLDRYESQGLSGLEDRPRPGVLPKVNGGCEAELKKLVEQEPREAGYSFSTWTCADLLSELVKKGLEAVSSETIRAHLHALGYGVRRPVLRIASPDPAYKQKVKKLKRYQKQAKNGELLLYYQDEIDLNLLPGIMRCWTLQGVQRKVPTPGVNQKKYGFGAVNYVSGQTVHRLEERKNSAGFCAFIEQFMQTLTRAPDYQGEKIVLVVDNFIIHHSPKTQEFLQKYADQLLLFRLPTYSPWLNWIERLWKHLRRKVTHNHLFTSIAELAKAFCSFLDTLNATPQLILSVIGATE